MNYKIRKLALADLEKESFFETLSNLKLTASLSPRQAKKIFNDCKNRGIEIYVATENDQIIGTIRLLFEPKFYHAGKLSAHIEDVATHKNHTGKGVASFLIKEVIEICQKRNCYKIILNCTDDLSGFYKKFGFKLSDNCLRLDV